MDFVWPVRGSRPLLELSKAQFSSWERNGYLVIPDAVPAALTSAAASTIREYIGASESDPATWYANTLDIYTDQHADGSKPLHGPAGMVVGLNHHASLWQLRQHPRLHRIFADLYGTRRLLVSHDRAHFKPPENASHPAWSDPGPVHKGLHFDVNTAQRPVPYAVQGVIYLEDTSAAQGPLHVVPGFHRRFGEWARGRAPDADPWRADDLGTEAVALAGGAGSLVVWHTLLPHGPGRVLSHARGPRISAYVTMVPVDAAPYLPPDAHPETPLLLLDAATLKYEQTNAQLHLNAPQHAGLLPNASAPLRRLSAAQRAERWRHRLPLLDEDPRESEMPRRPPGEDDGAPFGGLTRLGRRLTGLEPWPKDEDLEDEREREGCNAE